MRTAIFPWEQKRPIVVIDEKPEPVDVPTGSLNIDTTYQALAPRNPRLIKEIGKKFDLTVCGRLRVVRRANGALFVVDGRHRLEGARQANRIFVPCDIYDVHDRKREIEIFLACNTRIRKVPQGMLFMAEVAAGDQEAVALNRMVQDAGLGRSGRRSGCCVVVYRVIRRVRLRRWRRRVWRRRRNADRVSVHGLRYRDGKQQHHAKRPACE